LNFSRKVDTGYDHEHVLILPLVGKNTQDAFALLQQQFLNISSVKQVAGLSEIPYDGITTNGFIPEGDTKSMQIHQLDADENFLNTFGIKKISGDYFSNNRPALADGYVINETLAKTLDWDNAVGKTIKRNGEHKVIGVIKDFHFASMRDKIEPLIITNKPWGNHYAYLALKYQAGNVQDFMSEIRKTWKTAVPTAPFDYWFLDSAFDSVYKNEERFQKIFFYFSILSILLSLAGVFGLVTLTIRQRTKEFGVRKVLGAGMGDIIKLTAKSFIWLIVIGMLIISPIVWYYMNKWLQNFAYRWHMTWWVFAACGVSILVVTMGTISLQAIKAALANPVKSLRTE
jgi:putative ABC transport system permease protein